MSLSASLPASMPRSIRVLERGWLSCNNILMTGVNDAGGSAALVDSSYIAHAPQTIALLKHALAGAPLDWLVNTHCHSDHMGGNAAIQREFGCRTSLPSGEAALISRWDERELLLGFADQRAERFVHDDSFDEGAVLTMGGLAWQVIAAPGHDPHAVMFWSPDERVLISGDALWQNGFGVIFQRLLGNGAARDTAYPQTRATLEKIAALPVRVVIPGHGAAFEDVNASLARAFKRLESFEKDDTRLARHAIKVMLVFSLLERRRIARTDLPGYLAGVGFIAEINARFLQLTPQALADWLVTELECAGALKLEDGVIMPLVGA
jgi:glyoxylase-like metal-dependent hydrolase (beta-lactamase superfamily II)